MNTLNEIKPFAIAVSMILGGPALADDFSFEDALKNGDTKISFRARYESVEQDNNLLDATAITNRTRLTFNSAAFGKWQFNVEMDNVAVVLEDYNSRTNGFNNYSVIADPEGTDLNQAKLTYSGDKTSVVLGRQRINLDGQRFVGGVGWRQNEQTYDAVLVSSKMSNRINLTYAYVHNANNILGANIFGEHHIVHGAYALNDEHKFAFTGVYLDPDNVPAIGSSTFGLDYKGQSGIAKWNLAWATQSDDGNANVNYQADYRLLEFALQLSPMAITIGQEVLGSDEGIKGFTTPLATLHKFQGFADIFLATPDTGINDSYVKLSTKIADTKLALIYHDFKADYGSVDYGDEIDLVANVKLSKHYSLLAKYASYRADSLAVDTDKLWIMFSAKF